MNLDQKHLDELRASDLNDATIEASGIYSAADGEIRKVLGWQPRAHDWGRGYVIPFHDVSGVNGYARVKLDFPRHDKDEKPIKYESPRKAGNRAYFPPGFLERVESAGFIIITEGEKKALAAQQAGFACMGLVGVWGFQQKRQRRESGKAKGARIPVPDLESVKWEGRLVVIAFDSDIADKPDVRLAERELCRWVQGRGAKVRCLRLPGLPNGDKCGLDDYLVARGESGPGELRNLIAETPELSVQKLDRDERSLMDWAAEYLAEHHADPRGATLVWHRDVFWQWDGTRYLEVPESDLRAIVLKWLDNKANWATPKMAGEVVKCLASTNHVPHMIVMPAWLGAEQRGAFIEFRNGLLDLAKLNTPRLVPHTPRWFSPVCLPFKYDAGAACPEWIRFLHDIFDDDQERTELLARWFGLCLTADTSFQKLLLMVGPPRSGKGTVLRVLQHIVGTDACASPTLSGLASRFGLWPLLGRRVASFPDAHLGRRTDSTQVMEIIKSIVGEDAQDVDRKNLPILTNVRLTVRIIITVNKLPRFSDAADALGARLLILPFTNSYVGREDRDLERRLKVEAAGILNWAIDGLRRLYADGHFAMPAASAALADSFRRLSSPVRAFVQECCTTAPGYSIPVDDLYRRWAGWAKDNGHEPGGKETFGEELRAVCPAIEKSRPRDGERRFSAYTGITRAAGP